MLASHPHFTALHRTRLLWDMHVIEGLENIRIAIFLTLQHSRINGAGAIRLLERCLSANADARSMRPFCEIPARMGSGFRVETAGKRRPRICGFGKLAVALRDMRSRKNPDNAVAFDAP